MKKQVISIAVGLVVLGAGVYGGYRLGISQGERMSQGSPTATASAGSGAKVGDIDPKTGKKILYWHDPMVPGQRFDKPGKSPFMDMQLVPVYEDAGGGGAAVTIDSRVTQNLGIRTAEVKLGRLESVLEVPGNVAINERGIEVIQARTSGFVEHAYARTTLDPVKRGQPLVVIYSPDWVAAQEEYLAVARMDGSLHGDLRSAAVARMRQTGMNESQIRLVETTGKLQPRLSIASSVDGVVTEVGARDGMTVSPGMTLFRVADLSTVWVLAEVPESQAASAKPGQPVSATTAALPGQTLTGKVEAILPDVNPSTRTLRVRVELQNKNRQLVPGMFVNVRFGQQGGAERLLVPTEALIRTGARTIAMVETDNGGYSPVEVKTGAEADGQTEVTEGLKAGQKVVVSGQFLLDSEASLRGTTTRMESASVPATPAVAGPEHEGAGRIEAVTPEGLTISHGPIPTIQWGAMTMDFKAPPAGLPKGLKPGQQVHFKFHMDAEGMPVLSSVQPSTTVGGGQAMIGRIILASIRNRFLVLMATAILTAWGLWAARSTPLDALPDLSDVQVIIRTPFPGQAPQIVENQVTYPLTTTMLSVPGAKTVRGYSFFGDSFVYVLFEDGTDLYWARSRVLEYLNQVQSRLPAAAKPALGPDATGVGWVYEYTLVDKTGKHDLSQLRALQDWFLRFELKSLPNVAEVASIGGMVKQFQVVLMPDRLRAYGLSQAKVLAALKGANQETGGSVLELGEAEYMVRASGYLKTLDDFRQIPLTTSNAGIPVRLGDVATLQLGPEMRRGIAELDGQGEVAGGVIVMRSGKNALETIEAVKAKLATLQKSLPAGVEIVPTYDRSALINRAVENLTHKLIEEFIVVALVCLVFLFHLRSALVAIVSLPLGVLAAFLVMRYQGVNANIMSLGGIAIAIGAMVDAAVVMIENAHKHLERWHEENPGRDLTGHERWSVIGESATEVGPALFFSLLIITLSFIPVFTLEAQEGRLFSPLAFTKTYSMAAAAGLSVTLVPVLMGYMIRGRIPTEQSNPLSRWLIRAYQPVLAKVLSYPRTTVAIAAILLAATAWPIMRIGGEFMPPLDEGDLLYMPSALPGLSAGKAAQLLQQTDRLIKTVPEVATVFGKAGRADTATDPAPIEMFETTIQFKPREQWRAGMTADKLVEELDRVVKVPGLSNIWVPPIRNRIDMLATGIKSPVGIKVAGTNLQEIDRLATKIEEVVKTVPGVTSALAERLSGGRYIDVNIDRMAAGRYGLNIEDVQSIVSSAIGGDNVGEVVDGLARFPINIRYPRDYRDSVEQLRSLPIVTDRGLQIVLSDVAEIRVVQGPPMLRSENARLSGWVYVDIRGRDLRSAVQEMQAAVAKAVPMPAGYSLSWSGQFEYLERATAKLKVVVPFTLLIIFVLLYLVFGRIDEALLIMGTLPLALIGGFWLLYLLGYNLSVAGVVGFIALAGVAAEFGVIMLLYLKQAWADREQNGRNTTEALMEAIQEGAVQRVRPKAMTVAVILAGLIPIMWSSGTGSEVMQRIAAPMVGGMVTAPLLSLFVVPAVYLLLRRRRTNALTFSPQPSLHEESR